MRPPNSVFLQSIFAASLLAPAFCATPAYTVVDIGSLGGKVFAHGINDSGQVVGVNTPTLAPYHAFLYNGGVMADLGTSGGLDQSVALSVSGTGKIAGYSVQGHGPPFFPQRAFLYSSGVMMDLDILGGVFSSGQAINDSGTIVGVVELNGVSHAFRYSGGIATDLGLGGAIGINNAGQIVGYSSQNHHAFLLSGGVMTDLGTLGGVVSAASAINDVGQIVGQSDSGAAPATQHPFLYSGGVMRDLGSFGGDGLARAINSAGQVVGYSYLPGNTVSHAFLYAGSAMQDLNNLVALGSLFPGDFLIEADGINSSGQIIANGNSGHAYLLTPATALTITSPTSLPAGAVGVPYGPVQFTAAGGFGGNHWSVNPSLLPGGISLDPATGILSGTAGQNTQGDYTGVLVTVTDSSGTIASVNLTLHINPPPAPVVLSISPNPVQGINTLQTVFINGGGFQNASGLRVHLAWPNGSADLQGTQLTFLSSSQLSATFNFSIAVGNWTAQVFNPDGQFSNSAPFTVVAPGPGATTRMALPQIQFGGAWYSALYFSNTTNAGATVQVNFMDDANAPLPVPLVGIGAVTSRTVQLNPGATVVLEALSGGNSGGEGWVSVSLPAGVIAYEVLRQVIAGRADQEALVSFTSASSQTADFSYDDTALVTAAAFLNPSSQQVVVTVTAYGPDGSQVATTQVPLAPGQKSTDILKHYPGMAAITGKQGRVVVSVPNGAVSVLVLRFGGEAFTDVPVNYR